MQKCANASWFHHKIIFLPDTWDRSACVGVTSSTILLPAPSLWDSSICWLTDWLIGWSGARGVNWLIDCLEVGVAFIWSPGEQSSGGPHSSVMSNTQGKTKERWRAVGSLPRHRGHVWRKSQPRWEHAERTMGTWGQKRSAWKKQKR